MFREYNTTIPRSKMIELAIVTEFPFKTFAAVLAAMIKFKKPIGFVI